MDFFVTINSISPFVGALVSFIFGAYVIYNGVKTPSSYFLLALIVSFFLNQIGFFIGYSVFAEWTAYHRYLTILRLFFEASLVGFVYTYPRITFKKEAIVVIILCYALAVWGYIEFINTTISGEISLNFDSHVYIFVSPKGVKGTQIAYYLVFLNLISVFVVSRKCLFFLKKNLENEANWNIFRDRKSLIYLLIIILIYSSLLPFNILHKLGLVNYSLFSFMFGIPNIFAFILLFLNYIYNPPEKFNFAIKLVGGFILIFSFVTLIMGYVSLHFSEKHFHDTNKTLSKALRNEIDFKNIPNLQYALKFRENEKTKILYYKNESFLQNLEEEEKLEIELRDQIKPNRKTDTFRPIGKEDFFVYYQDKSGNETYEFGFDYKFYRNYLHETGKYTIIIIGFSILSLILLLPKVLKEILVKPLNDLLGAVGQVMAGNLDVKVPVKTDDEIGYLATSFNSMTESINQLVQKMKVANQSIEASHQALKQELELGQRVQSIYLSPQHVRSEYFEVAARSISSKELGGDFFDVYYEKKGNNKIGFVIGDVSGKGAGSALLMVSAKTVLEQEYSNNDDLSSIVNNVNRNLCNLVGFNRKSKSKFFITTFLGEITKDEDGILMHYVNAGHLPPILISKVGENTSFQSQMVLGVDKNYPFKSYFAKLQEGDVLLFYTDGSIEQTDEQEFAYGIEQLKSKLMILLEKDIALILKELESDVLAFCKGIQSDDMSFVIVRII